MGALQAMSPRGRIVLAVSALGIVFVAFMLFRMASAPSYTTLQAGVDPAKTGKITAALDQAGVSYKLAEQRHRHRRRLRPGVQGARRARRPGPRRPAARSPASSCSTSRSSAPPPSSSRSPTSAPSRARSPRPSGRSTASPAPRSSSRCPRTTSSPTRSSPPPRPCSSTPTPRRSIPPPMRGIASLVSSSVPNLKPANVTITDASGSMLWPQDGAGAAGGAASKPAAEARYAAAMQTTLGALIARTVGTDKAQVQVHADLNVDQATQEKLAVRQEGHAAGDDQGDREPEGHRRRRRRHRRRGRQPADLRAERGGGRRQLQLQAHDRQDRLRRRQDRHAQEDRARRRQQARRRAAGRQVGPARPRPPR